MFTFKELFDNDESKILNYVSNSIDTICFNMNQLEGKMDSDLLLKRLMFSLNDLNERLNPDTPKTVKQHDR